jgi:hypothetical protein
MSAKRPLGGLSRVAFETNCRIDPVPFVVDSNEHGCIWFRHPAGGLGLVQRRRASMGTSNIAPSRAAH